MRKIEIARQAVRDHPEMTSRQIAESIGASHMTVIRARNMKDVPPDVPDVPLADVPDGWALATVNTDALRERTSAPALGAALAVVLAAAESGELERDDVARIVAARWDLRPGDRLQYDDGRLFREKAPERPRRSVQHRAD